MPRRPKGASRLSPPPWADEVVLPTPLTVGRGGGGRASQRSRQGSSSSSSSEDEADSSPRSDGSVPRGGSAGSSGIGEPPQPGGEGSSSDGGGSEDVEPAAPDGAPADPPTYREQLVEIYREHNPRKLGDVDGLLEEWAGDEAELLSNVRRKYGVEEVEKNEQEEAQGEERDSEHDSDTLTGEQDEEEGQEDGDEAGSQGTGGEGGSSAEEEHWSGSESDSSGSAEGGRDGSAGEQGEGGTGSSYSGGSAAARRAPTSADIMDATCFRVKLKRDGAGRVTYTDMYVPDASMHEGKVTVDPRIVRQQRMTEKLMREVDGDDARAKQVWRACFCPPLPPCPPGSSNRDDFCRGVRHARCPA
jgi:hypothetical protein